MEVIGVYRFTLPEELYIPIGLIILSGLATLALVLIIFLYLRRRRVEVANRNMDTPEVIVSGNINIAAIAFIGHMQKSKRDAARASFVHSLRHIFRAPAKALLGLVLAMFVVISLGWLYSTINSMEQELERLLDESHITAQITRDPEDNRHFGDWQAYFQQTPISQASLDALIETGFVDELYLEALWQFSFVRPVTQPNLPPRASVEYQSHIILGISHWGGFGDIDIEFAPGFAEENFAFGTSHTPIPIIIRREMLASQHLTLGERAIIVESFGETEIRAQVRIIGVFDNIDQTHAINHFGDTRGIIIMPLEALRHKVAEHKIFEFLDPSGFTYMTVRISIDPSRNHQLNDLHDDIQDALEQNDLGSYMGPMPLVLLIDNEVEAMLIPNMQENLELLRLIFPIAISVSIAMAMGVSILTMLRNAKNVAIMRALGKAANYIRFSLFMWQVLVCITGIALGLAVLYILELRMGNAFAIAPLVMAGMYFAGAVMGTIIGVVAVGAKHPLDLLLIRE